MNTRTVLAVMSVAVCAQLGRASSSDWFVDCTRPDDSGDGTTEATAFRTLQAAMSNADLQPGHTVYVLPGTYSNGVMTADSGDSISSNRVVVKEGVRLVSTKGAERTVILGAPSPEPVDGCYGNGPMAVRCVYLEKNARLEGFTLTDGHVFCTSATKPAYGCAAGGGVSSKPSGVIADCIISNCVAVRGGGGDSGSYFRCRFSGNRGTQIGAHLNGDCNAFNCTFTKATGGSYDVFISPETKATTSNVVLNCTFDRALNQNVRASATDDTKRAHIVNSILLAKPQQGNNGQATPTAWYHNCFIGDRGTATDITIDDDCTVTNLTGQADLLALLGLGEDLRPLTHGSWVVDKGRADLYAAYYPTGLDAVSNFDLARASRFQRGGLDLGAYEADETLAQVRITVPGGGLTAEGIALNTTVSLAAGESLTFTLKQAYDSATLCTGFTTNGAFVSFEDFPNGWKQTVTGGDYRSSVIVEAVYAEATTAWYVDPVKGDDRNKGYHVRCAKRNVKAAMDLASSGQTVYAAPGWYSNETMLVKASDTQTNRVVVKAGVMFKSLAGPGETFIAGATSPSPVEGCSGNGPGAIRCVVLNSGSTLSGFTLTNGHTRCTSTTSGEYGGGVSKTGSDGPYVVEDCVIRDCAAVRGGAANAVTCRRCVIEGCKASQLGATAYEGSLYNCLLTRNGEKNATITCYARPIVNCTLLADNVGTGCYYKDGTCDHDPENIRNSAFLCTGGQGADYTCCAFLKDKSNVDDANMGEGSFRVVDAADCGLDAAGHPKRRSKLRNKGMNALYDETVAGALDLSGAARIAENVIDIGAYEYQPSSLGLLLFVR